MNTENLAGALGQTLRQMNTHIDRNGQIKPSSNVIKQWHEYDNMIWKHILGCAKILVDNNAIKVPGYVEADIEFLLSHIDKCSAYTNNVLYPTPKESGTLPDAVTHANLAKHTKSIKSRTFRTMMNVREALNEALDIWLPNVDTSKGTLAKPKFNEHFDVEY